MSHFATYDQAGLDAQYDLRRLWSDTADHIAHRERESAAVRARLRCRLDLPFGPSQAERLDLFPAAGPVPAAGAPCLAFIHGGYWRSSDKNDASYVAPDFVAAGVTVATVNYALAPAVTMDEIVRQNRAALAWLWLNAADLGIDRRRLFVAGHSAGGHLTAMMLTTDWPAFAPALPAEIIAGACALSGIYELEPIRLSFLNADVRLDEATAARNSPLLLPPRARAPMIVSVGALETAEYHRQQATFAAAWRPQLDRLDAVEAPGCHHYSIVGWFARAGTALHDAVRAMIATG